MIYDDQPQMVEAAGPVCRLALNAAFAALDREALIEKVAIVRYEEQRRPYAVTWRGLLSEDEDIKAIFRERAESYLVAAGIIPERAS